MRTSTLAIALVGCGGAAETEGLAPPGPDAMPVDDQVDAGADDAAPADGLPMPADCPNFDVFDDGSSQGQPSVVIMRIRPGHSVELFNRTTEDVYLSDMAPMRWFSYPQNRAVADDAGIVPALGCAAIPFPTATPTDARGELVLVASQDFTAATNIMDYVCWGGDPPHQVVQSPARAGSKWTSGCAPAIPDGLSLVRVVGSAGNRPGDYVIDNE